MVERCIVVNLQGFHHAHDPFRSEQAHDVIRHRQIKPAFSRISLTSGSAAELVVDSP